MKADELALEYARQLKAYCKAHEDCETCGMFEHHECNLKYMPYNWAIKENDNEKCSE